MDDIGQPIEEVLPLTETTFLILISLSSEPHHGYGIMKDVAALSDGRVQFSTGTLYGALRRLLEDGWIKRVDEKQHDSLSAERNRKYYSLTRTGRQILDLEMSRLRKLVEKAKLRASEARA